MRDSEEALGLPLMEKYWFQWQFAYIILDGGSGGLGYGNGLEFVEAGWRLKES